MMTEQDVRKVAAEAGVDPRTVTRALDGRPLRSLVTRLAVARALRHFGFKAEAVKLERIKRASPKGGKDAGQ